MTIDHHETGEPLEDDDFPSVNFNLRNPDGENSGLELHTPILGMGLYCLITPGDEAVQVSASHVDADGLAGILTFVLATLLQADEVSDHIREMAAEMIPAAVESYEGGQ